MAAGAAVGLMAHLRLRHRGCDGTRDGEGDEGPTDWLQSPYATVQAACAACMPLLNAAQELQSASGLRNAFRMLQVAALVALPQAGGHRWVAGAAAEGAAARAAQQAMCGEALMCAKVALVTMTVSSVEAVRVDARNALQVPPPPPPAPPCHCDGNPDSRQCAHERPGA